MGLHWTLNLVLLCNSLEWDAPCKVGGGGFCCPGRAGARPGNEQTLNRKGCLMSKQSSSRSTTTTGTPTTGRRKSAHTVAASLPVSAAPSTDSWPTLIKRWQSEDLTVEQAIGQLLLWGNICTRRRFGCNGCRRNWSGRLWRWRPRRRGRRWLCQSSKWTQVFRDAPEMYVSLRSLVGRPRKADRPIVKNR